MEHEGAMNGTIYEATVWHDIENNRMRLKKDGDHYVADAMLFRENANLRQENDSLKNENAKLRELFSKVYGYYVSGTLKPCDFCDKYCCEGDAPTTCESDEYDPGRIVDNEVKRLMRELRIKVN